MKKQEIRKLYMERRKQLSLAAYDELNQALLKQFKSIDLSGINCIHIFLPIRERREPDTFLLIDWLKAHHPQIKRVFPKADFADNTMTHFLDDDNLKITVNGFGIPEPVSGTTISVSEIDMVLIPLLAFDKRGYRVGYGKGFYDRFMAECQPGARFIGLSLFDPIDQIEDINEFDAPLTSCITPTSVYTFQSQA